MIGIGIISFFYGPLLVFLKDPPPRTEQEKQETTVRKNNLHIWMIHSSLFRNLEVYVWWNDPAKILYRFFMMWFCATICTLLISHRECPAGLCRQRLGHTLRGEKNCTRGKNYGTFFFAFCSKHDPFLSEECASQIWQFISVAMFLLKTHATFWHLFQQLVFGGERVKVKYNNFDEELMPHHQQQQQQQQYVKNDQNYQP